MLPEITLGAMPPIAHLDQYGGPWAIEERHARQLIGALNKLNLTAHAAAHQDAVAASAKAVDYQQVETSNERILAVIRVEGVMTKYGSSMSAQGSTLRARRELRHAVNDPRVTGILIKIDSPGGSVSGTPDLARDVADAATKKPVYAYCEDLCCSAAYYVASQADKVFANANAIVGSIGVYMVIDDWSKAFEEAGVQPHLIKFGAHKGDGVQGLPISDEMLDRWQQEVDVLGEQFVEAVQKGRGLTKAAARALADGRVHIGKAALDLKLIDGIQSLDKTIADLAKAKPAGGKAKASVDPLYQSLSDPAGINAAENESESSVEAAASSEDALNPQPSTLHTTEEETMATQTTDTRTADAPQAATYQQIVAGCKGCDPDESGDDAKFVASCLKRGLTAEQAQGEWMDTLSARIESAAAENAELKATAAKAAPAAGKAAGNKPVDDAPAAASAATASAGDPIASWNALVAELQAKGHSKATATRAAVAANPELHQQYLAAWKDATAKGLRPAAS